MKYVTFVSHDGIQSAMTCSDNISHADLAKDRRIVKTLLGAGFCDLKHNVWGESDSLGISSRPDDSSILKVAAMNIIHPQPKYIWKRK
jgi:hypothetical protein